MARLSFPAATRNREPILEVLRTLAPRRALEVACGSGEHAAHFAANLPELSWLPTDIEPAHRESVDAWAAHLGLPNLRPAQRLDVREDWPDETFDVLYCANMFHIAPWEATVAFFAGAARVVAPEGQILTYGPYREGGAHTAPSNAQFDDSLRERDPRWGVRDVDEIAAVAGPFRLHRRVVMPANNLCLVWAR